MEVVEGELEAQDGQTHKVRLEVQGVKLEKMEMP